MAVLTEKKATLVLTNEMDPETIETETFMMRPFEARLYRL